MVTSLDGINGWSIQTLLRGVYDTKECQATQKLNSWGWLARGLALERNKLIPLRPILAKQSR